MAEPRSGDDLAQLLMEKAAGDEKILLRLIDEDDIPDDGLGFHAQQAVEKMTKPCQTKRKCALWSSRPRYGRKLS